MSETLATLPSVEDEEKVRAIASHMRRVIELLGLDQSEPNLMGTPERVARMYLEMFGGLAEGA
ncbi:MAG TPA: GTP cyclohydrolase I, partial [Thermoanaerobaculia bacterium]|nr:GTP cyclohydrolase I [Thermoanaerobaculia bacterium]